MPRPYRLPYQKAEDAAKKAEEDFKAGISRNVKIALAVSGVTKEEASKAANISLPTLNQRLREPGFWRIDELVGIAKKCGTQAMAFFKEYREM